MHHSNSVGNGHGKLRTCVYIDGYNWYHAIFKQRSDWKWLNIQSLFEKIRSREEIVSVKVFSAIIDPENPCSDARQRQKTYFEALRTLPKIKIILGVFQEREVTCRGECNKKYKVPEEKKTDVNIAVEMISDAISGSVDHLCIVSGDSDVQPVVEWISKNRKEIKQTVYVPALPPDRSSRRTDYYLTKGLKNVDCLYLPLDKMHEHQLPNLVRIPEKGFASRPHIWR